MNKFGVITYFVKTTFSPPDGKLITAGTHVYIVNYNYLDLKNIFLKCCREFRDTLDELFNYTLEYRIDSRVMMFDVGQITTYMNL